MNAQADLLDITPTPSAKPERALPSAPRPQSAQVIKTDSAALMGAITRASKDASIDAEKLSNLMTLYERIEANQAKQAFSAAMKAAQADMRPVSADASNPQTRSKYASYAQIDRAIRPIYTRHGFSVSFDTADGAPADHVRVVAFVEHEDGHSRTHHLDMPADGKGAKGGDVMTKTHAMGSGVSYGRRYLLGMIFNIAVGDDDDGNGATYVQYISTDQVDDLVALMDEVGADRTRFLNFLKVSTLAHLPAARFKQAVEALEKKRGA